MKLSEINDEKLGGSRESNYLRLEQGNNIVRIVSTFAMRQQHYKKGECIGPGCPFCQEVDENGKRNYPSTRFVCHVIDRKDNKIKMAEFGSTIIKQLKALSIDEQYMFETIPPYNVTIKKEGQGLDTSYTVLPDRMDTPLTEQEKELIKKLKSPEEIVAKIIEKQRMALGIDVSNEVPSLSKPTKTTTADEIDVEEIPFN